MAALMSMLFVFVCVLGTIRPAKPPHVVFIVADDLGWNDVGWHNPQMTTPNLDKLAKAGVILNSSYVQPVCSPSRSSFMTGYFPYHTGLQHGVIKRNRHQFLPANLTTISQKLKDVGYSTHIVGKWHLGYCDWKYTPTFRGFDTFVGFYNGAEDYYTHVIDKGFDLRFNKSVYRKPTGEYSAYVFARRAVDIINSHDQSKPLYLYLPFQSVHSPLQVPKRFEDMYKQIHTKDRRLYCGMVSALDEAVGNITRALEENGFMDNLLLIFTTDNGGPTYNGANNLPLRGAKTTLWEGGTKGSAFVYSKTLLEKYGYTNTGMMHAVDWFPTILTAVGGKQEPGIDGRSQWEMISKGKKSNRTEFVYNIDEIRGNAAIRYDKYKLIEGSAGKYNGWYPLPKVGETNVVEEDNFHPPKYQLFDISLDPGEHTNIAEKEPEVLSYLKNRLVLWKKSLVPANYPPPDPKSNPKHYKGVWTPGWC